MKCKDVSGETASPEKGTAAGVAAAGEDARVLQVDGGKTSCTLKKAGVKRFWLPALCVLAAAAAVTGFCFLTGGCPRFGEYAGTVLLPGGGTVPCSVVLEAEANRLTGSAIQLPFGGRLVPEQLKRIWSRKNR